MYDKVAILSKQAMDYAAEQYGPQRAGEKVWDPLTYDRKFAELIVLECVRYFNEEYQREFIMPWREDLSKRIKEHFDIEDAATANILAGADQMAGDGGYREVSLKTPEFLEIQARHHALYNKTLITAADVQQLREITNCTMMDCKKALTACNGNMDEAIEYLRYGRHLNART